MTLRRRKKNWAMQKHLQIICQLKVCVLFENDFTESTVNGSTLQNWQNRRYETCY